MSDKVYGGTPQEPAKRCAICAWPLAESAREGCVPGNCSMRPFPAKFYDFERACQEYNTIFSEEYRPQGVPMMAIQTVVAIRSLDKPDKCGQYAGSITPFMSYACVLPRGHEGEHQPGGTCVTHGPYVGEQCPQWPNCVKYLSGDDVDRIDPAQDRRLLAGYVRNELFRIKRISNGRWEEWGERAMAIADIIDELLERLSLEIG